MASKYNGLNPSVSFSCHRTTLSPGLCSSAFRHSQVTLALIQRVHILLLLVSHLDAIHVVLTLQACTIKDSWGHRGIQRFQGKAWEASQCAARSDSLQEATARIKPDKVQVKPKPRWRPQESGHASGNKESQPRQWPHRLQPLGPPKPAGALCGPLLATATWFSLFWGCRLALFWFFLGIFLLFSFGEGMHIVCHLYLGNMQLRFYKVRDAEFSVSLDKTLDMDF